ncbi:histone-lysine N-methyltransferase SETMAR [Plakobranchus ocellatus]|uniref:Histone-lysine N-methyltransferase SETMAR n=1 Tax=Plakobranchus ocellatus TaxID=259542 RepID=A0AAV4CZB9_9GAST|nr:histone-lysine N-methyltransferase SETMAR [Plakobranchus ocellatus]
MVSSPRIDFNSLCILKGDLSATFADPFELITISFLNGDQPEKGDTLIKVGRSSAFLLLATEAAPRAASVQGFFATSGLRWVDSIPDSTWEEKEVDDSRRSRRDDSAGKEVGIEDKSQVEKEMPPCPEREAVHRRQPALVASYDPRQPRWSQFFPGPHTGRPNERKEAIRRKRPGLLRRGVVLQHDNATPRSANLTQQWLQRYVWEILPHPAHSPDLAPSDFHLFGPLKRHLGGMAFETEDDLISELRNCFDNLYVDFFRMGINSLLSRWQKCIDLHGDYVAK